MTVKSLTTLVKKVDFPVYGLDFTVDDHVVAVGGGGSGRSGVKNKLISFAIDAAHGEFTDQVSLTLPEEQDCPMSVGCSPVEPIFATGINESEEKIKRGDNPACKIFSLDSGAINLLSASSASTNRNVEDYQKVARFSPQGRYLVTGCTDGRVTVFNVPEMTLRFPPVRFNDIQDCDIDPDERHVAVATAKALIILALEDGTIVQVINSPRLNKNVACEFRSCRYSLARPGSAHKLFAAVNPVTRGRGFICVWDIPARTNRYPISRAKTASVCRKGITSFCLSPLGDLLAYASTDLSIGLVDAKTLRPIMRVKEAHGFAITSLVFSRSGKFLASAGADTQCRIMIMPEKLQIGSNYSDMLFAVLSLPLLVLLIHIIVQLSNNT